MAVTSMRNSSIANFQRFNKASAEATDEFALQMIIAAGGGAGGTDQGGGGGAGGVFVQGMSVVAGTPYTVTIGAGAAGHSSNNTSGGSGSGSVFGSFSPTGGGGGGGYIKNGLSGGSGGGAGGSIPNGSYTGGTGLILQGQPGGNTRRSGSTSAGAGGGGLTEVGLGTSNNDIGGDGGDGYEFTFGSQTYGVGGGGAGHGGTGGTGGVGGSGDTSVSGSANTGGGGGGSGGTSGSGGSGVVALRLSKNILVNVGAGLTYSTIDDGGLIIYRFTAGTDTVVFS